MPDADTFAGGTANSNTIAGTISDAHAIADNIGDAIIGHWNGLPREAVTAPSLSEFKELLDDALSHIVSFRQSCEEQGVGLNDPYGSLPT